MKIEISDFCDKIYQIIKDNSLPNDFGNINLKEDELISIAQELENYFNSIKQICKCEHKTGWTQIKCCNICGYPIPSENWWMKKFEWKGYKI